MEPRLALKGSTVPTRRTVLQSAVAFSAAPIAPGIVFAGGNRSAADMGILYDHRYQEARAFRLRAAQWDVPITGTLDGDITDFYQNHLRIVWKQKPAALAGLTERPALFLLERLAWDYGLRVVFEARHEYTGGRVWAHHVVCSGMPGLRHQLDAAGATWPAVLADQILSEPAVIAKRAPALSGASMAASLSEPTTLHSWIIAPRPAASVS